MGAPLAVIRMYWPHPCRRGATVAGASAHDRPLPCPSSFTVWVVQCSARTLCQTVVHLSTCHRACSRRACCDQPQILNPKP